MDVRKLVAGLTALAMVLTVTGCVDSRTLKRMARQSERNEYGCLKRPDYTPVGISGETKPSIILQADFGVIDSINGVPVNIAPETVDFLGCPKARAARVMPGQVTVTVRQIIYLEPDERQGGSKYRLGPQQTMTFEAAKDQMYFVYEILGSPGGRSPVLSKMLVIKRYESAIVVASTDPYYLGVDAYRTNSIYSAFRENKISWERTQQLVQIDKDHKAWYFDENAKFDWVGNYYLARWPDCAWDPADPVFGTGYALRIETADGGGYSVPYSYFNYFGPWVPDREVKIESGARYIHISHHFDWSQASEELRRDPRFALSGLNRVSSMNYTLLSVGPNTAQLKRWDLKVPDQGMDGNIDLFGNFRGKPDEGFLEILSPLFRYAPPLEPYIDLTFCLVKQ